MPCLALLSIQLKPFPRPCCNLWHSFSPIRSQIPDFRFYSLMPLGPTLQACTQIQPTQMQKSIESRPLPQALEPNTRPMVTNFYGPMFRTYKSPVGVCSLYVGSKAAILTALHQALPNTHKQQRAKLQLSLRSLIPPCLPQLGSDSRPIAIMSQCSVKQSNKQAVRHEVHVHGTPMLWAALPNLLLP